MDILDAFYSRTYENSINKKMLYYDYEFPQKEVEDYVRKILDIPVELLVHHAINTDTAEAITPKDVFQFSTLEAGTLFVCNALTTANNPGVTFVQAGKLMLNDGKPRKDTAYIKYGENHLKTAEGLGLLYELTRTYFVSCVGVIYLALNEDDQKKLIVRLLLRNKFISRLMKAAACGKLNARQFLYMLSDTTYIRRKSNLKTILRYLASSSEYDFAALIENIYFP